jgi:alkaline phosphatase D
LYGGDAYPPICLQWKVSSSSKDFSNSSLVNNGFVSTTEDVRFSVKVEATGLKAYTKYYYRFESCSGAELGTSPIGEFKTLPGENDLPEQIRLAFFSCSNRKHN